MVSDAAKKKALAKKLSKTAKFQGKDAADAQAASISHSAVRAQHAMCLQAWQFSWIHIVGIYGGVIRA